MSNQTEARNNLTRLGQNPYPGRGIVLGVSAGGEHLVQIYWIMGRSENSRNRVFSVQDGLVFTEAADPSKVKDPSLIIYNAMDEAYDVYVVSNGVQTDDVLATMVERRHGLLKPLEKFQYEPDAPNFTPRITGCFDTHASRSLAQLAILRKSRWNNHCDRLLYSWDWIERGFGFCITTYTGDGDPLPSFQGEPLLMPIQGNIYEVAKTYWSWLNPGNSISLAVKFIPVDGGKSKAITVNKYTKVEVA